MRGARLRTLRRRCDAPSSAPIIQIASAALSTQLQRGCCLVAASLAHSLRPWRLQHVVAGQFDRPATDSDRWPMPRRAPVFKVLRLPVTAPAAHSAAGTALVACVSPARPGHGRVAGRAESGCRGTATLNCYAAGATLARSRTVSSYRPLAVSGCKLPLNFKLLSAAGTPGSPVTWLVIRFVTLGGTFAPYQRCYKNVLKEAISENWNQRNKGTYTCSVRFIPIREAASPFFKKLTRVCRAD